MWRLFRDWDQPQQEKSINVLDAIPKNIKNRLLIKGLWLCGIKVQEAEFYAGHLRTREGLNVWTASEKALNQIAYNAAEACLKKSKFLTKVNENWGRNTIQLNLVKYFVAVTRYGGHQTILKILVADVLSCSKGYEKNHLLLCLPSYFTTSLFDDIRGHLELHTYSLRKWSLRNTRLSVLMLIAYVGLKHLQKYFQCKPKFGDVDTPALLLSQEDDLSLDRSYRGQPHWLFKDNPPPDFRTLILETGNHQVDGKDEMERFGVYTVPKRLLYYKSTNLLVKKKIYSAILVLLYQSVFGSQKSQEIYFHLAHLFIKAYMLAGLCHSQNVKAYMTCENYFQEADAMNLIGPQMGIHTLSYQYSNLPWVTPLMQTTADTMCTFSKIFQERWEVSKFKPKSYVNIGYLFDSSFQLVKERAHLHREEMEKYGANFIIGYYDESIQSREDKYGIIHEDDHYLEISNLMNFVINNNDIAVIIKSQFNRNSPRIMYDNDSYMKQAVKTNRFLDLHKGVNRNICFPAEAAMAADIVIGHVIGATAGLEAALTGKRCILLNPYNMLGRNIEIFKKCDILYDSIGSALNAIKEFRNGNIKYMGLGDWSPIIDLFDPFRDGKSAKRLRLTLENIMSERVTNS